jgi:hypothetical protein
MCFDAKLYLEKDKCNAWVINLFLDNKIFKNVPTSHVLTSFLANRKWNQTTVAVLDCTQWSWQEQVIFWWDDDDDDDGRFVLHRHG